MSEGSLRHGAHWLAWSVGVVVLLALTTLGGLGWTTYRADRHISGHLLANDQIQELRDQRSNR